MSKIKFEIPCVIFAGGKSSRMGEDKALLPFGEFDSLSRFQLERFKPFFSKTYISVKDKAKFNFKADFIEDIKVAHQSAVHSPMIALLSVFEKIKDDFVFIISVDTPFFEIDDFEKLFAKIDKNFDAIISKEKEQIHPLVGIYKRTIIPKLQKLTEEENHKMHSLLKSIDTSFVDFDKSEAFINLNTPKEYEKAKKLLSAKGKKW